jgi:hypothetical protein
VPYSKEPTTIHRSDSDPQDFHRITPSSLSTASTSTQNPQAIGVHRRNDTTASCPVGAGDPLPSERRMVREMRAQHARCRSYQAGAVRCMQYERITNTVRTPSRGWHFPRTEFHRVGLSTSRGIVDGTRRKLGLACGRPSRRAHRSQACADCANLSARARSSGRG